MWSSLVTLLALLLLTGCTVRYAWERPGVAESERQRDNYECNRDAAMVPPQGAFTALMKRNMYEDCMRSKGYQLKEKSWWGYL